MADSKKTVLIGTSARHVHVSRATLDTLFGKGYELTHKKDLLQPGQFACEERVEVRGPKKSFPAVSILGPVRPADQVELSITDARSIGLRAPVRESGDVAGSDGCTLVGPLGEVDIKEGVIVAKRHIHATPADAERLGLRDQQNVNVCIESDERSLMFGDVVVRVRADFALEMHIDTDESNAGMVRRGTIGAILP